MNELPDDWEKHPDVIREMRLAQRKAYCAGWRAAEIGHGTFTTSNLRLSHLSIKEYPITRKVPREIPWVGFGRVKVEDGAFLFARYGRNWWVRKHVVITPENVRALADLLDNPYETVEE